MRRPVRAILTALAVLTLPFMTAAPAAAHAVDYTRSCLRGIPDYVTITQGSTHRPVAIRGQYIKSAKHTSSSGYVYWSKHYGQIFGGYFTDRIYSSGRGGRVVVTMSKYRYLLPDPTCTVIIYLH